MVISAGLMERTSYWEMEERVVNQGSFTSGDALFTEAVFSKTRVLMTDPGELALLPTFAQATIAASTAATFACAAL